MSSVEKNEADENASFLSEDASENTDSPKSNSFWKDSDRRQKSLMMYLSVLNFAQFLCIGAASPFLAREVVQLGGSIVASSLVLLVFMLTMTIFCPVFGKYQSRIGSKTLIITAQTVFSFCQIAFGAIGYIRQRWNLIAVGVIIRATQGVCQGALTVAALTVVCQEFPAHVSTVFGIFEAAYGAGYLTAPYLGGYLYDVTGGMMIPMAVTGLVSLLAGPIGLILLRSNDTSIEQNADSSFAKLLNQPKILLLLGIAAAVNGGFALYDSTITLYLKPKGFSVTKVGQILFLTGLCYCVMSALTGWLIVGRMRLRRILVAVGFIGGLAFPLLFTPQQTTVWVYIASIALVLSTAILFVATFSEIVYVAECGKSSAESNFALQSAVSAVWNSAWAIGCFCNGVIGSALETVLPFSISFLSSMLTVLGIALVMAAISAVCKRKSLCH